MTRRIGTLLAGALALALTAGCAAREPRSLREAPDAAHFDAALSAGLRDYFAVAEGRPVRVESELLRREPTWIGDARPRWFAWVTVAPDSGTGELRTGAVRVAATGGRLIVTDFASREQLLHDPNAAMRAFPTAVAAELLTRAHR